MKTKHAVDEWMRVGEAAALVGVSIDTLKRWERAGRISAKRTPTGHRRFLRSEVEALMTIREAS